MAEQDPARTGTSPAPRPASTALASAPSPVSPVGEADLRQSQRLPILAGLIILGLFFGVFGGWAALAPLAGGSFAHGVVSPDGSRKTVQHLEGGIVSEILVKDGDRVKAGDPLLVLEGTQARASFQLLDQQRREFLARHARLEAELARAGEIDFPPELLAAASDPAVKRLLDGEREQFRSRTSVLAQRKAQFEAQIAGLKSQIERQDKQLKLVEEELKGVEQLVKSGNAPKPRLLALKRETEEIRERRAANNAEIARARETILNLDAEFSTEASTQLQEARARLAELSERLSASSDILKRTTITSPEAGTIVQLRFKTAGGVIRPGEPILDIVPEADALLIDAQVNPSDIDLVRPGLEAQVVLTAFSQSSTHRLKGIVKTVSADRLVDERSGAPYFLARVEIDAEELARAVKGDRVFLTPGMQADVLIVTKKRTILAYLLEPFSRSFRQAFREN